MASRDRSAPAATGAASKSIAHGGVDAFGYNASLALRPYQAQCLASVTALVANGTRRILLVAATGSGKTVLAAALARKVVAAGHRVLFLAHRRELIGQASGKLYAAGIDHGVILAGHPSRPYAPVQIASIATLHARAVRSSIMDMPAADVVIVDEAHHVRARTYEQILDAYPGAVVVGLTATPCRGDGRGLGNAFDEMVEAPSVGELIRLGFLVPTKVYAPNTPDLKGVAVARGDYVESQLAERIDTPKLVGDLVEHWHRLAERRPTVVFATGVKHSVHIRDEFRRSGVVAEHLDGTTPNDQRDAILQRLARGEIDLVTNAAVLVEGWDSPSVSCLVLARPTKSLGLYRQMVGRVLRPAPGKTDALILDHAGATLAHGFAEDPIEWTLATDEKAHNPTQKAREAGQQPRLTTCPECHAIRQNGEPCPACGWQPRKRGSAVEVADGELVRFDRTGPKRNVPTPDEKRRFWAQLAWIGDERGYKPGWAAHKFKEKFGHWPPRIPIIPEAPEPAVRAWVRSRQIAYAKARAR